MLTPKKPASSAPLMVQKIPFSGASQVPGDLWRGTAYIMILFCVLGDGTGPSVTVFVVVCCI
jgi:hypothetical protein